jgi:hypothetical protein
MRQPKHVPRSFFTTEFRGGARATKARFQNLLRPGKKRRGILALVILLTAVLFSAAFVSCTPQKAAGQAVLAMDTQYYDILGNVLEIPLIQGDDSPEAQAINREVLAIKAQFQQGLEDVYEHINSELMAYPTTTERYLNLTLYDPVVNSSGNDGEIHSWVYDKQEGRQVTQEDALALAQISQEELRTGVEELLTGEDPARTLEEFQISGFRIGPEGEVLFYLQADVADLYIPGQWDLDGWRRLYLWSEGALTRFDGSARDSDGNYVRAPLLSAELVDETELPLWCRWYYSDSHQPQGGFTVPAPPEGQGLYDWTLSYLLMQTVPEADREAGSEVLLHRSILGGDRTMGVVRYSSAAHAGGFGNLILGVFDNRTSELLARYELRSDDGQLSSWLDEEGTTEYLLCTNTTTYQGVDGCTAAFFSFDGQELIQITQLPQAAFRADVTLPDGAESMLDPAQNLDFWADRRAAHTLSGISLYRRNPAWNPQYSTEAAQWLYECYIPLSENTPPTAIMDAARQRFDQEFLHMGEFPSSSVSYPITSYAQVTDGGDPTYPNALIFDVILGNAGGEWMERQLLFDQDYRYLGARSNGDFALQIGGTYYHLGAEERGIFGTPTSTNLTQGSDGLWYYSEWFSPNANSCVYLYDSASQIYRLSGINTGRSDVVTVRGIHVGSTVAEVIAAYPEANCEFTPQTHSLTYREPLGGCRLEFYFEPNGGLEEPREETLKRTITSISLAAPTW